MSIVPAVAFQSSNKKKSCESRRIIQHAVTNSTWRTSALDIALSQMGTNTTKNRMLLLVKGESLRRSLT